MALSQPRPDEDLDALHQTAAGHNRMGPMNLLKGKLVRLLVSCLPSCNPAGHKCTPQTFQKH